MNYLIPSGLTVCALDEDEFGYPSWSIGIPHASGQHYEDTLCIAYDEAVAEALTLYPEFITFVTCIIQDFEMNHVLGSGKIVDNPLPIHQRHYEEAKALMERFNG